MTEIPQHLLDRSKARRAALGGGGGDAAPAADSGGGDSGGGEVVAAAPAAAAAPAPAAVVAAPEPPAPVPHYIKAAEARPKIPVWAMPIVAALPLWGLVYAGTLKPPVEERMAVAEGRELYEEHCASCHGAEGGGGVGYSFTGGAIVESFPNRYEQMLHIARGSVEGAAYGNPDRSGGQRVGGTQGQMPAFADDLSLLELELIVFHERSAYGEEEYGDPEEGLANEEYLTQLEERYEAGEEEEIVVDELIELFEASTEVVEGNLYPTQGELDAAGFGQAQE